MSVCIYMYIYVYFVAMHVLRAYCNVYSFLLLGNLLHNALLSKKASMYVTIF